MKVLWFGYIEEVVCNRNDLILNQLFNFEPMEVLEHGDVRMFGSASKQRVQVHFEYVEGA